MEHTLDRLEEILTAPRIDWSALFAAAAVKFGTNVMTGLAIGIGVAAGLSWAG
jgi:hypothetical protein